MPQNYRLQNTETMEDWGLRKMRVELDNVYNYMRFKYW